MAVAQTRPPGFFRASKAFAPVPLSPPPHPPTPLQPARCFRSAYRRRAFRAVVSQTNAKSHACKTDLSPHTRGVNFSAAARQRHVYHPTALRPRSRRKPPNEGWEHPCAHARTHKAALEHRGDTTPPPRKAQSKKDVTACAPHQESPLK